MKIGIDISQVVYEGTGVATYTRNLVRELLRLNGEKNQYLLFGASLRRKKTLDQFALELSAEGLKFNTSFWLLPPTFTEEIWNQIHHVSIEKLIGKVDVFHTSDWTEPPSKMKKVTTIHDLVVYKFPEYSHPNIIAVQKRRFKWVVKESKIIIADSEATKKDITHFLNIPGSKIRVIHLAAGENYWSFSHLNLQQKEKKINEIRKKYQLDKDYLLSVGTQEPRKNLDRLITAFSKNSERTSLVIAGKIGWGENKLSREHSSMKNLKVLGFVSQEDLPAIYAGAKAFIYPSLYEGFGVPILEAMTVGCPVITSNSGSLPEASGDAAIYVDPRNSEDISDKIDRVMKMSTVERSKQVAKCLTQAKKFSWKKTATETLAVYQSL